MAKVSAHSDHELHKITVYRDGNRFLFTLTSDGRVLWRLAKLANFPHSSGGGYKLLGKAGDKIMAEIHPRIGIVNTVKAAEFLGYLARHRGFTLS